MIKMNKLTTRQRLLKLVTVTKKKFVLDENSARRETFTKPKEIFLMSELGLPKGVSDEYLFNYCCTHDYILITRDKGMVFRAILDQEDIVYVDKGNYYYITNKVTVSKN